MCPLRLCSGRRCVGSGCRPMRKLLLANGFGRKMWVSVLRQGFAHPDPYSVAIPCASSRKCSRFPPRVSGPRRGFRDLSVCSRENLGSQHILASNARLLRTLPTSVPVSGRGTYSRDGVSRASARWATSGLREA